jgi:hypothetical protein
MGGVDLSGVSPPLIFGMVVFFLLIALVGVNMIIARQIEREQANKRHDLRNELHLFIAESEERITARVARLEETSYGFRRRHLGDIVK